ncbi:MAG: sulfotransferase, partial [Phycisphaerales bacterium]|nr:sulfotransferase [Phycisphaerales bacterium]
ITAEHAHAKLIDHWKRVLPCPWIELEYETIVREQENQTRRLLEFLDLPWDDRCMQFHQTERTVLTPSYEQVNKPLHGSSIGRWRHYEKHIGPLIAEYGNQDSSVTAASDPHG